MKGKTKKSDMAEMPGKMPKDILKGAMKGLGKPAMVGGAKRPKKMYGGGATMGMTGNARGMGAAVKGGKFRDL